MKPKKLFSVSAVTTLLLVAATSAFAQAITRIRDLPALKTPTTISGRVVGFGEADENEWIIDDGSGQIRIDAGPAPGAILMYQKVKQSELLAR